MSGLRISQVAERTGLPASTIRYYESAGLVEPAERGSNGYRQYGDADVERLLFIAGAKRLNLGLGDVRQLVTARESDLCEHVQRHMRDVVAARLTETQEQIAELSRLADELRRAQERLSRPTTGGVCSDACACAVITGNDAAEPPAGATVLTVSNR
ncbi:MerR family transcriptional regulator [Agromyces neolithicus]|uniref:Helix-turn-helix domain-containing protein n=1 Tax=Agromyces neolithicus TaxID=269420 RepID=A0ABN2MAG4_9MICO